MRCQPAGAKSTQNAVWKRTTVAGGPIPVHGRTKLIDVAQADALWDATMSPTTSALNDGVNDRRARARGCAG
jgi:hypothetical protein